MKISMWLKMGPFYYDRVKNIIGKGENAGYQHVVSPFLTMFSTLSETETIIFATSNLSSANVFNFVKPNFYHLVKN